MAYVHERALERVEAIAGAGHDLLGLWQEAGEAIGRAVPHHSGLCWFTLDPASLLMTSHFNPAWDGPFPVEFLELEYDGAQEHDLASVARSAAGASTLHDACGGDPRASRRWQANMEMGGDQELIVALRTRRGDAWATLSLYQEPGRPVFDAEEIGLLTAAAPALAEGARRALLLGEASDPERPDSPAVVVLAADGEIESSTPSTSRWISDLPGGDWDAGRLGPAVAAVARRARQAGGESAVARVRTASSTWVIVHGAPLVGGGRDRVAVILEPATPARITPLLMAAYGLTEREQEVTRLVLQGCSTDDIARRLVVSPHTVQEHFKHIFAKTGVRSRRDLVGKVFFNHYEPRVRDNEERAADGLPLRGGPR